MTVINFKKLWQLKERTFFLMLVFIVSVLLLPCILFGDLEVNDNLNKYSFSNSSNGSAVAVLDLYRSLVFNSYGIQDEWSPGNASTKRKEKPQCVLNIKKLNTYVSPTNRQQLIEKNKDSILSHVLKGGSFKPPGCNANGNVAVIVPYRDREQHLNLFLPHMHSFLQTQMIDYTIFVVEMTDGPLFNRGLLMNIGFHIATQLQNFTCFVFHDIDLLPTNERNLYDCNCTAIRLMGSGISKYDYSMLYPEYFGGVVSFTKEKYLEVNGFSNLFFGWGEEDDELRKRVILSKNAYVRTDPMIGRYESLSHIQANKGRKRTVTSKLLKSTKRRWKSEGLNSLYYKHKNFELRDLYTWILVDVDGEEIHYRYLRCEKKGWPCDF